MSNDINDQNIQLEQKRLTKSSAVTGKLFNALLSMEGDLDFIEYYCKKLDSLKHLVRTTVAESHN